MMKTKLLVFAMTTMTSVFASVPDPGNGEAPPGSEGLVTILKWVFWVASGICVLGIIAAGAMMAVSARHGRSSEHVSQLGFALAGCIVIGAATGIVGALL